MDNNDNNVNNNDDFSFSDVNSIINYIINNYHKFLLLITVFLIIYFVDYISNINAFIYNRETIPGLASLKTPTPPINRNIKIPKQKKQGKKIR